MTSTLTRNRQSTPAFLSYQLYSFLEPRPMTSVTFESDSWMHVAFGRDAFLAFNGELAPWKEQIIKKVASLGALPENWNSYRSRPIDIDTAGFAICTLLNNLRHDDPMPSIVPTSNGGVMVEWHVAGVNLEIDFQSPTWVQLSFEKDGTESEVDDASLAHVAECIAQLRESR